MNRFAGGDEGALHPETVVISLGRPAAVPDGPLNVPITPASALQAGGPSGYARDGHAPWAALEEVIGTLEGGRALTFASGMAAATAAIGLFEAGAVVVAPEVAYMDERSQHNAAVLAERLSEHPDVSEVRYPGLPSHPQHRRSRETLAGAGFMLTFRVRGGAARADALVDAVRVLTHATSLGGVESTLERRARYPAESGVVPDDLLRVSVGCEHVEDLWSDLQRALAASIV